MVLLVAPRDLGKPRPGVIVQADELGATTTTVLICPMSSDIQESPRLRPIVEPDTNNGLRIRSQIMTEKVTPVRRDRVRRVLGSLDASATDQLDRALLVALGLAR
ncbi:MAG TPA: type II toxin-antitoxin system PemK/MazF family toxin [Pseudolabrys sp.]|nr:type II toxin-antitoxin system PemK/MazF family toxin [Pseudolabrys sp.]